LGLLDTVNTFTTESRASSTAAYASVSCRTNAPAVSSPSSSSGIAGAPRTSTRSPRRDGAEVEKEAAESPWIAARCGRKARVRVRRGGRGDGSEGGDGGWCRRTRRRARTEDEEEVERRRRERAAASMVASPEGEPS